MKKLPAFLPLVALSVFLIAFTAVCLDDGMSEESSAVPWNDGILKYELSSSSP